jgi:hypothetical protein
LNDVGMREEVEARLGSPPERVLPGFPCAPTECPGRNPGKVPAIVPAVTRPLPGSLPTCPAEPERERKRHSAGPADRPRWSAATEVHRSGRGRPLPSLRPAAGPRRCWPSPLVSSAPGVSTAKGLARSQRILRVHRRGVTEHRRHRSPLCHVITRIVLRAVQLRRIIRHPSEGSAR